MTSLGTFALLFAPSGQGAGGGIMVFVFQIAALIAIFYFMLIRPQRRQQERHRQLLESLQRGDRIAQMVVQPVAPAETLEVDELPATVRAGSGFGSSGGT